MEDTASGRRARSEPSGMRRPEPLPVGPGQESVWAYPRPPRLEQCSNHLRVELGEVVVADSSGGHRVLETSHPPTYYLPPDACDESLFVEGQGRSFCEWKGRARYWTVRAGDEVVENGCWSDPAPSAALDCDADAIATDEAPAVVGDRIGRLADVERLVGGASERLKLLP